MFVRRFHDLHAAISRGYGSLSRPGPRAAKTGLRRLFVPTSRHSGCRCVLPTTKFVRVFLVSMKFWEGASCSIRAPIYSCDQALESAREVRVSSESPDLRFSRSRRFRMSRHCTSTRMKSDPRVRRKKFRAQKSPSRPPKSASEFESTEMLPDYIFSKLSGTLKARPVCHDTPPRPPPRPIVSCIFLHLT